MNKKKKKDVVVHGCATRIMHSILRVFSWLFETKTKIKNQFLSILSYWSIDCLLRGIDTLSGEVTFSKLFGFPSECKGNNLLL